MPLAIEPLHPMYAADRACVNTMAQANDLCDELGEGLGIAVDVYHVWWDPQPPSRNRARRRPRGRLLAFHICDWLVPTSDLLLDRGMMGDGVIDLPLIRSWMDAAGYRGAHEVEIFSAEDWWKRDPDEVLITCIQRHQTVGLNRCRNPCANRGRMAVPSSTARRSPPCLSFRYASCSTMPPSTITACPHSTSTIWNRCRRSCQAAAETDSPVIMQASAGARKYAGEMFLRHLIEAAVETYPHIPIVMHQDHGQSPAVCESAMKLGFSSVMMDGSLREDGKSIADYDYNLDVTRKVVERAHASASRSKASSDASAHWRR